MTLWWSSWSAFWAMGGHAFFVWMSFGALLAAIVVEMVSLRLRRKRALAAIEEERDLEAEN
ncbi:MAG TPA: heme exporter protein CcmD [Usitatibacteraceae bacterium]|jgi:heme exporter protein D|nr:heme exporter protein CcmD [Usitatibacteraceae bacterium]